MAAFQAAAAAGADLIELDVRFSADLACVVMHDRTVRRTTDGWGQVHRMTLSAIRTLDAGRWFSPRFAGQRVPILDEVLEMLPPSIGVNCEVKTDGDPRSRLTRVRALSAAVERHRDSRTLIVSSFDHRFLSMLSRHAPWLTLGVLLHPLRDVARRPSVIARRAGASCVFCSSGMIRHRLITDAHDHGLSVGIYVIDTVARLARVRRYGADMVFTNYPERVLPWLGTE